MKLTAIRGSVSHQIPPEEAAVKLTPEDLSYAGERCPRLHLHVQYFDAEALNRITVAFGSHKTLVTKEGNFTLYHVRVKRMDGYSWSIQVRYSDVHRLRQDLLQILPYLRTFEFPDKTYFNWLSCCCSKASNFDEERIVKRKHGMERFLNEALKNLPSIQSDTLNSILKLSD